MVLNLGTRCIPGSLDLKSKYVCNKLCHIERKTDFCTSKYCRSSSVKSLSFLEFASSYIIFTIGLYESNSQWAQRQPFLCGSQVLKQWRIYPFSQWLHPPELLIVKPGTSFSSAGGQLFTLALISSPLTGK